MRVLLVEDNESDALLVAQMVHDVAGITLVRARSLAEGLAQSKESDVVLLDLHLPDSPPESTVEAIEQFWPRPVLVCSAAEGRDWMIAAGRHGAVGYLVKGAPASQLVNSLYCAWGQSLRVAAMLAEKQTMRERLLAQLAGGT